MTKREIHTDRLFLFDAMNEYGYNEDEANGGGLNTDIDMLPFEDGEVFQPLVETPQYWDVCADQTIARENRHVDVPRELNKIRVR